MEYLLVVYIYAGIFAQGDSVAITSITSFETVQECQNAGEQMKPLVRGTAKELRFVCVEK